MFPKKILIIEDNPLNQKLFYDLVLLIGHQGIICTNAEEGLSYLNNHFVDLILLDLQLPQMSGLEFIENVLKNKKLHHIKIIIISSFSQKIINNILVKGYIQKPISVLDFIDTITKTIMDTSQCQHVF